MDKVYTIWSQHEIMIIIGGGFIILDFFKYNEDMYYYNVKFDGSTSEWIENYVDFLKEINKTWDCGYSPQVFEEKYLKNTDFIQEPTIVHKTGEVVKWD